MELSCNRKNKKIASKSIDTCNACTVYKMDILLIYVALFTNTYTSSTKNTYICVFVCCIINSLYAKVIFNIFLKKMNLIYHIKFQFQKSRQFVDQYLLFI